MKIRTPSLFQSLPDTILFDTDNTLYAYEPAHQAAMIEVCRKACQKLSLERDEFLKAFHEARAAVKRRLGETAASHSRLLYMQATMERIGLGSQILLSLDLEQTYWRSFLANSDLFDGVLSVLDEIRQLGITTAIVTDLTAQIQFRKVVYFGLDNYFDYVITSEEAGADKPNISPFKLAMEKCGTKNDSVIWMIGDNPVNDIAGAKNSINAVTIQKLHKGVEPCSPQNQADATFTNFRELLVLLRSFRT